MQTPAVQEQMLKALEQMVVKDEVSLGGLHPQQLELALGMAAKALPEGEVLSERQVNQQLLAFLASAGACFDVDHVELRRWLADFQWLQRDGFGREYRRSAIAQLSPERAQVAWLLATLDVPAWVRTRREAKAQLKRQRQAAWQRAQAQKATGAQT